MAQNYQKVSQSNDGVCTPRNTSRVLFVSDAHVNGRVIVACRQMVAVRLLQCPGGGFLILLILLQAAKLLLVFASVQPQALRSAEASAAHVAAVRPLACVQPDVVLQTGRPREALVALGAVVLLPQVDLLVLPQAARLVEAAVAQRAVVRPLARVGEPVSVHGARVGETLAAVRAGEGLLARVHLLVTFELAFLGELLAAQGALVGLLSRVDPHVDLKRRHLVTVSAAQSAAVRALGGLVRQLPPFRWLLVTAGAVVWTLFRHREQKNL